MNQTMDMKIGQVVRSKAGRDKGILAVANRRRAIRVVGGW